MITDSSLSREGCGVGGDGRRLSGVGGCYVATSSCHSLLVFHGLVKCLWTVSGNECFVATYFHAPAQL